MLYVIIAVFAGLGVAALTVGILKGSHPGGRMFAGLGAIRGIKGLYGYRPIQKLAGILVGSRRGRLYRFYAALLEKLDAGMKVETLYLLKLSALFTAAVLLAAIRITNVNAEKTDIILKQPISMILPGEDAFANYCDNLELYREVIKKAGKRALGKLDESKRLDAVKRALDSVSNEKNTRYNHEKAYLIALAFKQAGRIRVVNWRLIVFIGACFWLPECLLAVRRLMLGSLYRKEVVKLENIFELLGSIKGFKSIDMIREMGASSKVYRKQLESCMELFKTEKQLALDRLKAESRNSRFSRMADILRIYALTDKAVALQILERSKLEKEEQLLVTAEEDLDIMDVIAFLSIVPILVGLADLIMRPMLDVIYEAFRFL